MADDQARISSRGRITLPREVRARLRLRRGDTIRLLVGTNTVTIDKVKPAWDDPFATFIEWASDEDERHYLDLE